MIPARAHCEVNDANYIDSKKLKIQTRYCDLLPSISLPIYSLPEFRRRILEVQLFDSSLPINEIATF